MATRNLPVELSALNLPDSGETTIPPAQCIAAGGGSLSTGNFRLVYFTAAKTESITKISTYAATAAAATPTLCRIGIYTIDGSGKMQGSHSLINAIAPRLAGTIGSQTNLPASVAVGTIGNTAIRQFFWLKP